VHGKEAIMTRTTLAEFGSIDRTADPEHFIRFLDAACAEASFRAYKELLSARLDLREGSRILDVGCGTGDDARAMARLVGSTGLVIGLDNSTAMIDEARRRAAGAGLPVEFRVGDALALPFEADYFDGCRADRSLMHVPDVRQALAEMARVTRPDSRLAVYEVDFGTLVIDADDRALARKIADTWNDSLRDGWLGRRIPALLREVGLRDIEVLPHTLILSPVLALPILGAATVERAVTQGSVTPGEGQTWLTHLDDLQRQGRFFSTLGGFLVFARK
jgi:ubiquinone/menaquinone biosynthesis C-methylase UbiE